jgi:leader peptidase (prepilin peptidase)/N-methyltransferase
VGADQIIDMKSGRHLETATIGAGAIAIAGVSFAVLQPLAAAVSCALGWTMLAIAVSDARRFIVPDVLSLPAIPLGLLAAPLIGNEQSSPVTILMHLGAAAAAAAIFYAIRQIYFALRRHHGLGLGDVKLAAAAGAWTGFEGLSIVLLLACVAAMSWTLATQAALRQRVEPTTAVPFGAFLAPAIWLTWWFAAARFDLDIGSLALMWC